MRYDKLPNVLTFWLPKILLIQEFNIIYLTIEFISGIAVLQIKSSHMTALTEIPGPYTAVQEDHICCTFDGGIIAF